MKEFFDKLKQEPGRIFGLVYPYILIIGVGLGLFYIGSLNYITRQEIPPFIPDTNQVADIPLMEARKIAAVDITKLADPSDTLLARGKTIFNTLCASCHGEDGTGNGVAAAALNPSPRNFTSMSGWVNGPALDKMFETINLGIPGSAMASFQQLSTAEKFAVAHYIRKNFVPDPPPVNVDNLKVLDQTYNLSQEKDMPAQIPVSAALELILKEKDSAGKNISSVLNEIKRRKADSTDPGAKIFNEVSYDKTKALTLLSSSADWKQDEPEFVMLITADAEHNGFNRKVFYLNKDEITSLQQYLQSCF